MTDGTLLTFPDTVTPDGKSLIVQQRDAKGQWALNVVSLAGSHDVTALLAKPFNEQLADLSPDGKWIAYESDESGAYEIYVRPFPRVDEARLQIWTVIGLVPAILAFTGIFICCRRVMFHRPSNPRQTSGHA